MVIRLLPIMEDEELEQLRLAALQTLKPRGFERKNNYVNQYNHNYHQSAPHHHNTKPFVRMNHNPNLIVIIPTEVKEETTPKSATDETSSVTKNGTSPDKLAPASSSSTTEEKTQEPSDPEPSPDVGKSPDTSKKVPARFKRESRDEDLELDFDEEELDFESEPVESLGQDDDCIALHADDNDALTLEVDESDKLALHDDDDDDEDSLEKLMDEMEQEFSGNKVTSPAAKKPVMTAKKDKADTREKSPPAKGAPPDPKTAAPAAKEKSEIKGHSPPIPSERKVSPIRRSPPPTTRSRSPIPYSESARAKSPSRRSRSPVYVRARSPRRSPVMSRRSPLPRRLSRSPLPRRSRSPLPPRRSKSPYRRVSPYRRSKSPLHRRTPPRRLSPLPRRSPRRSPQPILSRRSRSRSRTPPRREYRSRSPLPPRRRTRSPSFHRRSLSADRRRPLTRRSTSPRRRSPSPTRGNVRRRTPPPPTRRSPLNMRRSPLPARAIRRRSTSPSRRPLPRRSPIRRQPRELRTTRAAESDSRSRPSSNSERRRTPIDNRSESNNRKEPLSKSRSDEELERNKPCDPLEESDPKLEARRRKFESITVVSGTQKKICLKSSSDDARAKGRDSPVSPSFASKEVSTEEVEESVDVALKTQRSSPLSRISRGNLTEDRGLQTRIAVSTTKDTQTKSLPGLFDNEDNKEDEKLKPTLRYTVENAKEEIELMKLKRRRKTEQILGEEGENRELLHIKKKKKKKIKEKKKEKKRELLLADIAEADDTKPKISDRVGVAAAAAGRAEGTDLRAELSRRRAQRLQGQPGSRLIQSALEGVVADKKIKPMRLNSPPADSASAEGANKTKGRRVHVVAAKKKYTGRDSASDSEDLEDEEEAPKTKRTSTGILRGTTLHRRSQVLKK